MIEAQAVTTVDCGIGYNVALADLYGELKDWFEAYLPESQPEACVTFDRDRNKVEYVLQLAERNPRTVFEYRPWLPQPGNPMNGDNQWLYIPVVQWAQIFAPFQGMPNVRVVVDNEPNPEGSIDYQRAVISVADKMGVNMSVAGYAYGQPVNHLDYSRFDPLIRDMLATDTWFDLHEYAKFYQTEAVTQANNHDPATWPAVLPKGQRWLVGRFVWWLEDCAKRGLDFPNFIVGEAGWATRGDVPAEHLFPNIVSSWGRADWQWFMAEQLKWVDRVAYGPYKRKHRGSCLFTLSQGSWEFSSYRHAPEARKLMAKGFRRMETAQSTGGYTTGPKIMRTTQTHINLRDENGNDIGDVLNTADVDVLSTTLITLPVDGRNYSGQKVSAVIRSGLRREGYLALTSAFRLEDKITDVDFLSQMRDLLNKFEAQRRP
jgi:hypothetical protein